MTLGAYLTRCRIQKAMALLREGKLKVYEVAEACGYRDIAYFSGTFKKSPAKALLTIRTRADSLTNPASAGRM